MTSESMRLIEIGYATSRNGQCDYAKWVMRLFEIGYAAMRNKKGMYSYRKSTSPIYCYDKSLSARVL